MKKRNRKSHHVAKHPMYGTWWRLSQTGRLCDRWRNFLHFVEDNQAKFVKHAVATYCDDGEISEVEWVSKTTLLTRRKKRLERPLDIESEFKEWVENLE